MKPDSITTKKEALKEFKFLPEKYLFVKVDYVNVMKYL